jgi:phospholipid/cholesterol/gamma-HCH transport system substrate-binding protein
MRQISAVRPASHTVWRGLVLLVAAVALTSCGNWRGIDNMPIPGGPGSGPGSYTINVQMPDTLALNTNSRVLVADAFVGKVRAIRMKNWVATLTVGLDKSVQLPKNATAKIGQTSLLGSQHLELAAPPDPSPRPLTNGDTIPLQNSSAYPTTERTLASIAIVLRGGGIPNLEVIADEVNNMLTGRGDQIRAFLGKLDTFTAELNKQREDIARAIDSTNRLLAYLAKRSDVLDRALRDFPPLIEHFAEQQQLLIHAIEAVGRLSQAADHYVSEARSNFHTDLQSLQCPLRELGRAAPDLPAALHILPTQPFTIDSIPKIVRGDYLNLSGTFDLTLSTIDNGFLTGTGFSGSLRALEQSWGRDLATMLPDVRFTTNPNDAPGGPLVERGGRDCSRVSSGGN